MGKICEVEGCNKPTRYKSGNEIYCPMHKERLKRNGSLSFKKDSWECMCKVPRLILDKFIYDNLNKTDKEIASLLQEQGYKATTENVKYRRFNKLGLAKNNNSSKGVVANKAREAYGEQCEICSYNLIVVVHHLIEKHKGGSDDLSNLCVVCPNCHALIHRGTLTKITSRKEISKLQIELKNLYNN